MRTFAWHHSFIAACSVGVYVALAMPTAAQANLRLPYADGASFVVVQGYEAPPTHINKDAYAIDFSRNGCDAYGAPVAASSGGIVIVAQPTGYNGGYGAQVMLLHDNHLVTRYAHLIGGSAAARVGDRINVGAIIGAVGNTGWISGYACATHPGTHLHFAEYMRSDDGNYTAIKPEPMSGFRDFIAGRWYRAGAGAVAGAAIYVAPPSDFGTKLNDAFVTSSFMVRHDIATHSASAGGMASSVPAVNAVAVAPTATSNEWVYGAIPIGGISASGGAGGGASLTAAAGPGQAAASSTGEMIDEGASSPSSSAADVLQSVLPSPGSSSFAAFETSTLSLDFSWQPPAYASGSVMYSILEIKDDASSTLVWNGTSTAFAIEFPPDGTTRVFAIGATDESGHTSTATTSVMLPNFMRVVQADDGDASYPSWYEDNWYQLGMGFYGTIRSLTLEGAINNPLYFASHLYLDEFLDSNYAKLNRSFHISNNAPFTSTSTFVTIGGLDIPLQPNKYYRLDTYQDYQNRSVVLRGTSATGTMMSDAFISGTGRVESTHPFYPYLAWTFIPEWPPLARPGSPPNFQISFDAPAMAIDVSWGTASDADTTSTLLTYEYAIATSSQGEVPWRSMGGSHTARIAVAYPNQYRIAVRARDDLDNVSESSETVWNFPAGYFPLPSQSDHSTGMPTNRERVHLDGPVALSGIALWSLGHQGIWRFSRSHVVWYADDRGAPGLPIGTSDTQSASWTTDQEWWYSFPAPLSLPAGDYWFAAEDADMSNGTTFYGNGTGFYYRLNAVYASSTLPALQI